MLALYADDFHLTTKGQPWKMTLVHVVILNLPPDQRYEERNTIQLLWHQDRRLWSIFGPF